jgi:hypothetical protein
MNWNISNSDVQSSIKAILTMASGWDSNVASREFKHYESISSGAQYVTLSKYFSHPNLVMYSFAIPPIKLKLGQQIGEELLIANHLDQSETLSRS